MDENLKYTAFDGYDLLSQGSLEDVVLQVKRKLKADAKAQPLIFSDGTGKQMDFDLSGSEKDVLARLMLSVKPSPSAGPGRPKLGVISREVSLLPRHWEWLSTQSGGASSTLRRLVDEAKKESSTKDSVKQIQERTYKVMSAIAGNLPNYEEALRALYRRDGKAFQKQISDWPTQLKTHIHVLSKASFTHK